MSTNDTFSCSGTIPDGVSDRQTDGQADRTAIAISRTAQLSMRRPAGDAI